MTNALALVLIGLVAGFFLLDHFVLHIDAALFLGRRGLDLIEWLAFWR
jgi:hypothetical protein